MERRTTNSVGNAKSSVNNKTIDNRYGICQMVRRLTAIFSNMFEQSRQKITRIIFELTIERRLHKCASCHTMHLTRKKWNNKNYIREKQICRDLSQLIMKLQESANSVYAIKNNLLNENITGIEPENGPQNKIFFRKTKVIQIQDWNIKQD